MAQIGVARAGASYYRSAYTTAEQARALASHKLEIPLLAIAGQNGIGRNHRPLVKPLCKNCRETDGEDTSSRNRGHTKRWPRSRHT
jgi:hypothetical protein